MSGEINICNSALIKIGVTPIVSFTDNVKSAQVCNLLYPVIRDELLSFHYWNFAMRRKELALLSTTPEFGLPYEFQLPADCIRVRTVQSNDITFKIEGRKLLADSEIIQIQYISNETDPSQFSPQFKEAISSRLAANLAYSMTASRGLSKDLFDYSVIQLRDARSADGQEGIQDELEQDIWLESRYIGAGRIGNVEV